MTDYTFDLTNLSPEEAVVIRDNLREIIKEKSLKLAPPDKPFILTSGKTSTYYIDGKKTTCDPNGLFCLSMLILENIRNDRIEAVGGPTLGADPMVSGASLLSYLLGRPIPLFIVRKEAKKHGTQSLIEGAEISGKRVAVVEDVITTGGSALRAIDAIRAEGGEIVKMIALVDREQGGREAFEKAGVAYAPLFTISELLPLELRNPQ